MNFRQAPFLQVKISVVNYGNYAGDNICCIYADFEVVLFVTGMLVDLSVAIKQVAFLLQL